MPTPHTDNTVYSNSVSVGITFLIGVYNWSLNILILLEKADSEVTGCATTCGGCTSPPYGEKETHRLGVVSLDRHVAHVGIANFMW